MSFSSNKLVSHIYSVYYAPRGRQRIFDLGIQIAQQYLMPSDKLIGVIGEAGSGKSVLVKGMFPGLELTNDDDGVNVRPLPLLGQTDEHGFFTPHTYHLDIRFEMGFTQLSVLADAIKTAIARDKRVIVEHFDLVYPVLGINADLLIGVGEEIILMRPNLFGPDPQEVHDRVYHSMPYRLMAHTAEDLCEYCMPKEDLLRCEHDDVRHGFIIAFPDYPPAFDIKRMEKEVQDMIARDLPVTYQDDSHITIEGNIHACTGPRTHVPHTGLIKGFHLAHEFIYDQSGKRYLLVGMVGENAEENLRKLEHKHMVQAF